MHVMRSRAVQGRGDSCATSLCPDPSPPTSEAGARPCKMQSERDAAETLLALLGAPSTSQAQAPPASPSKIDVSDAGLAAFEESVVILFATHVHNPAVRDLDEDQAQELTLPVPPDPPQHLCARSRVLFDACLPPRLARVELARCQPRATSRAPSSLRLVLLVRAQRRSDSCPHAPLHPSSPPPPHRTRAPLRRALVD